MRRRVTQALVVVAGLAISGTASAMSPFEVIEPADLRLSFHQVVLGVPTPVQHIHLRNYTSEIATADIRFCPLGIVWPCDAQIALLAGQEVIWDLYCLTDDPAGAGDYFDLYYCGANCDETSGLQTIVVACSPPVMSLSALQVNFSTMLPGETQQRTVTITNRTNGTVNWPLAVTGAGFALVGDASITLAAGASGDVTVEFHTTTPGSHTGNLEINPAGDPDHFAVPLTGTTSTPMVTSDSALAFGDVAIGQTGEVMLAIHNLDTAHAFRIAQLAIDDPAFTAALPADPTIAAGAMVMVPVHFAPTAGTSYAGQLSVLLDGDDTPIATVDLTGQGIGQSGSGHTGGGGCNTTGAPGIALALLALVRRRRVALPRNRPPLR